MQCLQINVEHHVEKHDCAKFQIDIFNIQRPVFEKQMHLTQGAIVQRISSFIFLSREIWKHPVYGRLHKLADS